MQFYNFNQQIIEQVVVLSLKGEGMEQFKNLSIYRRSIQRFAADNHFEIYDVIPDGNCMFRALADQFMINGRNGYTAETLRGATIEQVFFFYIRRVNMPSSPQKLQEKVFFIFHEVKLEKQAKI